MTLEEIREALARALPLRPPRRSDAGLGAGNDRDLVRLIEDYMLDAVYARDDCEQALYFINRLHDVVRGQWTAIAGYESFLAPMGRAKPTREDIDEARAKANPLLKAQIVEVQRLRDGLTRQISRLNADQEALSRAYTLISGT